MSAGDDIIERIKKLLRLARSSNPHEAQLALARAMALAHEHGVAVEGLNPDEQAKEKKLTHQETKVSARLTYDSRYAWVICRAFFNVDTVDLQCVRMVDGWPRAGVRTAVVGTESDIVIATYVHAFLVEQFSHCWRSFRGRLRNRHAYVHGMYRGLFQKLHDARPTTKTGFELVVKERETYIAQHIGPTTSKSVGEPDHEAHAASNAGWLRGQKTEINMPLQAAEPTLALTR